ncbi:nicotinate phosphoribosyltransferase [Bombilactobacillus bombi]|uniref:nicotinate phosphoribosyltransferase n=1 Tax=Bombilactobacillus bombi TaxID=1303590 RepID=UPI0015E5FB29|nr:nicotinate phosphoribosyltransferase [Bombilactobacillus bombi]MBA1434697.1 nicotinate phosphoribosyltransferase [Bombilactobacillus bombi]
MKNNHLDDSLALHTDYYILNMMYTYWKKGINKRRAVFECYFRQNPFNSGYAIFAGLQQAIEYLQNLHFTETDIAYLREYGEFDEEFLQYLKSLTFSCDVNSVVEGDLIFANEPIFQVEGPIDQCSLVETAILSILNYQILIATKASRIKSAAGNDTLLEFGSRRAQELEAGIWGARAAYIAGFDATSNVRAGKIFGIPVAGTHAHALVQYYQNDYQAFKSYAQTHHDCTFLVDTYDTLKSGVPSAIRVAKEMGTKINFRGVRIDSGDMAYISKRVREKLDAAGYPDTKIVASNDLDENKIQNLKMQGAKIDTWGVGTRLITGYDQPALGAVYKMVAIEDSHGNMLDTLKLSSNVEKISTPGQKQVWRITNSTKDDKSEGDYVTLKGEDPNQLQELHMFHPHYTYISKTITNFKARPVLQPIFENGRLIYKMPTLQQTRTYCRQSLDSLWEEYKRDLNPQDYPVDLSKRLYNHKMKYIEYVHQQVKALGTAD